MKVDADQGRGIGTVYDPDQPKLSIDGWLIRQREIAKHDSADLDYYAD